MTQSPAGPNRTLGMEGDGESPDTTIAFCNSDRSKLAAVLKLHPYVCVCILRFIPIVDVLSKFYVSFIMLLIHDTTSATAADCVSLSPNGAYSKQIK